MIFSLKPQGIFRFVAFFALLGYALVLGLSKLIGFPMSLISQVNMGLFVGFTIASILGSSTVIGMVWGRLSALNSWVAPNINGVYQIQISSNWLLNKAMYDCYYHDAPRFDNSDTELSAKLVVLGELTIEQSLFSTRVRYKPVELENSTTLNSHVVLSSLSKCSATGKWLLRYIFDGRVTNPTRTDVTEYQGAAVLSVELNNNILESFTGLYWTNRSWHQALNTAGEIVLTPK